LIIPTGAARPGLSPDASRCFLPEIRPTPLLPGGTAVAPSTHVIDIRHLLCPTDFSDASRHALEQAAALAQWSGARMTILHVAAPMSDVMSGLTMPTAQRDLVAAIDDLGRRALEESAASIAANIAVDVRVAVGRPWREIVDEADRLEADVIVLGTHGVSGFQHVLLGSVTEKVLRSAHRPVLTVPPRAPGTAALPFKQVLCPVDFSDSSTAALKYAFALAQEGQACATLLHVVEWPWDEPPAPSLQELPPREAFYLSELRRYLETEARGQLASMVPREIQQRVTPRCEVVHGKAYREILRMAAERRADLIVIGVRGRNALDRAVFGSTTNQVVRRATCPVLTIGGHHDYKGD
jgi:nucleotide-binding universal stress UspA family protein